MKYCWALDIQNMIYHHQINPGTLMDTQVMKITICGVYFVHNSAILQTEAGGNTEEIEVNRQRRRMRARWKRGRGKVGEGEAGYLEIQSGIIRVSAVHHRMQRFPQAFFVHWHLELKFKCPYVHFYSYRIFYFGIIITIILGTIKM